MQCPFRSSPDGFPPSNYTLPPEKDSGQQVLGGGPETCPAGEGSSLLSRTTVSEVTEALWEEYEEFATRDLGDVRLPYLFLDGIAERLHPGAHREAILAAWAITREGRKVLLYLAPWTK